MKKFLEIIKNKWLIKGTTTIALVVIVFAFYVLLNWGVEKLNVKDIDVTTSKLFTLSDESKDKLSNIDEEITLQAINMKDYESIRDFMRQYTKINKKVKLDQIDDLSTRVDLMTKYNLETSDQLIVVKTAEQEKTLTIEDLYTYDYSTNEQIDKTEEAITNAIVEVTIKEKPQIYILTGSTYYQTEEALSSIILKLKADSNEVNYLDILSKGSVPEDCDCLVITTLSKDISELERDKILEYIQNGGNIMMLTSQNILNLNTPNFNAILSEYGISIGFGAVFEQDKDKMLQNSPEFVIADVKASFMSNINMNMKICMADPGKIEFADEEKLSELGVEYEEIATTSDKSFLRTDFDINSYSRTEHDYDEESSIVGALVTKTISSGEESEETSEQSSKKSELIIFSNEICASNMQIQVSNQYYMYAVDLHNNKDVILNSISHLTERTDTITIRKQGEQENYTVTEKGDIVIKIIIFTIPVLVIIAGIVVWQLRRRKK